MSKAINTFWSALPEKHSGRDEMVDIFKFCVFEIVYMFDLNVIGICS